MNNLEIKTVARNFYESYNNHDVDKSFKDYIDINLINHTMGGTLDREKWLNLDKAFFGACPDIKFNIKEQVAEENRVVTHWACAGTHTGDFMGMPASGNSIQLEGISIDRIEDGVIKEHFAMADFTLFMQQFVKK